MSNGKLDSPNLDDRTWQDIVDEAKALIPKYAPEWTDHNPSDLGITLIELFAWIVEGMIYRLNRVPEKNFIEFLNLLGITRDPATPASTFLTYRLAPGTSPTGVAKGSLAATQQTEKDEGIVFETDVDLTVLPSNLMAALLIRKLQDSTKYYNVTKNLISSPLSKKTLTISAQESIMIILGFDSPSTEEISLLFDFDKPVETHLRDIPPINITWLYSAKDSSEPTLNGETWSKVSEISDETNNFQKNGRVKLKIPVNWDKQNPHDWKFILYSEENSEENGMINQPLFWIGLIISNPRLNELNIDMRHILFNSVSATNAITVKSELLGKSNGKSFQSFELKHHPLFKRPGAKNPYDHLIIQVREPQVGGGFGPWVCWTLRDYFEQGPSNDFRLDPVTGTISFGNCDPTKPQDGYGKIPPVDCEICAQEYRYVIGGVKGNVPTNTVNLIRTPIPGIISVTNPGPAEGGLDEEDIEETKRRGPEILRNRYRAVTVEDYEYLAREATKAVKKVRCLPPRLVTQYDKNKEDIDKPWTYGGLCRSTGNINVIIIPDAPLNVRTPMPSDELIQEVSDYLDEKRTITSKMHVTCPRYLPISVTVNINIWQQAVNNGLIKVKKLDSGEVKSEECEAVIKKKIDNFLHPILGGPDGNGWEVGQPITISTLFDYIKPRPDIGFISNLTIKAMDPVYNTERPPDFPTKEESVWVKLADFEIICSAEDKDHTVKFTIS